MPVSYFTGAPLDIRPRIVASPVDPLEQAIRQAQLYNLQQEPDIRRKQLGLQQLGLTEQQRHNKADEVATTRSQDVAIRGQDVTATDAANNLAETIRFHTATIEDANKQREAGLTQALIAHLTPLAVGVPGFDVNTLADTLKRRGLGEVADAITQSKAQHVSDKVDQLNTQISAAKGNQKVVNALVNQAKGDPDWKYIQPHLPAEVDTTKPLASPESSVGKFIKALYGSPQLAPF